MVHLKVWEIELHAVFSSKNRGSINKYVTQDNNMHPEVFWGGVLIFATLNISKSKKKKLIEW